MSGKVCVSGGETGLALDSVSKRETGRLLTPAVCQCTRHWSLGDRCEEGCLAGVFGGFDGCWDRQATGVDSAQRPLRNACG